MSVGANRMAAHAENVLQHLPEAVDSLRNYRRVVGDVSEVAAQLLVYAVLLKAGHQSVQDTQQRPRSPLKLNDLTRQLIDAARHACFTAEHLGLDLVDVVLQAS